MHRLPDRLAEDPCEAAYHLRLIEYLRDLFGKRRRKPPYPGPEPSASQPYELTPEDREALDIFTREDR
ncbi:MAG: hypothetical protein HYW26_03845 [Candidatus Aenigmarchaeota archaeon]|nr:hypothetical protein [Candidatus Aenigmarchaeota archaeon]